MQHDEGLGPSSNPLQIRHGMRINPPTVA
jgi:hypothetical protein